ncbi:HdeA family protein [Hydrogenophaga sp.]|uniref:HdeA family protein n=1 Tax=Hydrogenophaga sp. TaxID=1904254 RepID=UPI00286DE685|nr:HdeA family protein [Hydrogenophaga sp.]
MNALTRICSLALVAAASTAAMAETPPPSTAPAKPIVKTTCADYVAMNETFKPKFIYFATGHGKHGAKEAVIDEVGIETIQPELDEFCKVNLSKSAYDQVIASSIKSEQAAHKAHAKKK